MSAAGEGQRQLEAAYAAIRELDDDLAAGRLSAADHAELRRRSERQAAALHKRLRETGAGQTAPAAPPPPRQGSAFRGRVVLGVGALGLLGFGLAAGLLLARSVTTAPAPGPTAGAAAAGAEPVAVSPALEALRKEVETERPPIKSLLAFAHLALDEGQVPASIWAYRRVIEREPKNAEALTHLGVILYRGGHVDQALARVDEALAGDPTYAHAHWDRAHMLLEGKRDQAAAARAFEAFLALVPTGEDADRARSLLAGIRATPAEAAGPRP